MTPTQTSHICLLHHNYNHGIMTSLNHVATLFSNPDVKKSMIVLNLSATANFLPPSIIYSKSILPSRIIVAPSSSAIL